MTTIHCSSLPLIFSCPASAHGSMSVTAAHEAADAGSACHEAMTKVVQGLDPDLDGIALRWGCDRDELGRLTWYGKKAWAELAPSFPNPETEVEVHGLFRDHGKLTGHVDLASYVPGKIHALDWKTGRIDADYFHQVAGYARCLFGMSGDEVTEVVITIVWLRDQAVETYPFTREKLTDWWNRLEEMRDKPNDFRTGPHCGFCPRNHECPALRAVVKRDVDMFAAPDAEVMLAAATPAQLVAIRRRAKLVAKFAESADDMIRKIVEAAGPLDAGDGTTLTLVEENGRREVDTEKAWPVLEARLDDGEMAKIVSVSIKKAEDAVAERAPYGGKSRARKELSEALKAAGAITQPKEFKLKEIRTPKEIR